MIINASDCKLCDIQLRKHVLNIVVYNLKHLSKLLCVCALCSPHTHTTILRPFFLGPPR